METFPYGEEFCRIMKKAGFTQTKTTQLNFGIATIYQGWKGQGVNCSTNFNIKETVVSQVHEQISKLDLSSLSRKIRETGGSHTIRIVCQIDNLDLLSWLNSQDFPEKVYWADRASEFQVAGVGVAASIDRNAKAQLGEAFSHIQSNLNSTYNDLRYYGGSSFSDARSSLTGPWKSMDTFRFILPQFEIVRSKRSATTFNCNLVFHSDGGVSKQLKLISANLEKLNFTPQASHIPLPKLISKKHVPEFSTWKLLLQEVLGLVNSGKLEKIVLARKTLLRFDQPINPYSLLEKIQYNAAKQLSLLFSAR